MEDNDSLRKLVELIFNNQFNSTEKTAPALSTPPSLLKNDFHQRLQGVLYMKHTIFNKEWREYIGNCSDIIFSSHEMYVKCFMLACLTEYKCSQNVFESLISVCVLLKLFNDGILTITKKDFRDLNTYIFMILYENVMKRTFCEQGGFRRLVEYIRGHRYLSWEWNWKALDSTDDPTRVIIPEDVKKKVEKEKSRRDIARTPADSVQLNATSTFLAEILLATTSAELPTLPSNPDMIKFPSVSRNEDMVEKAEKERSIKAAAVFVDTNVTSQEGSNSDSKTSHSKDNAEYENIIQAVIKHNHSISSHRNSDNHIQKEADGILEHLMDKIKSLKTVLDDYDKE